MAAWWPVSLETIDSWPYVHYALGDLLGSPQHPPGYSALLAALGMVTRSLPVVVYLQFAAGIASALVLFATTRRLTGSAALALAPAAVVLLGPDQIYLEHTIMAEAVFLFVVSLALYAAARALDDRAPLRWAVAAGLLCGVAMVIRTAGSFMLVPVVLALLLGGARRSALTTTGTALAVMAVLAGVQLQEHGRAQLAPSPGWHLYSHAAQYADCRRFVPPPGTATLCENTPRAERRGSDHYLWGLTSPGHATFDPHSGEPYTTLDQVGERLHANLSHNDAQLGAFARAAVLAQPLDYATTVARDLLRYFVPGVRRDVLGVGSDLSPQLDFERDFTPHANATIKRKFSEFFNPFEVQRDPTGIAILTHYQWVFRFGATPLTLCALLIVAGMVAAPRWRVAILLLGGSGLTMLIPPVVAGTYSGRYTVPAAGLIVGGAAVAAREFWRRLLTTR